MGGGGVLGLHGVREGLPERRDPGGERRRGPEGIGEMGTPGGEAACPRVRGCMGRPGEAAGARTPLPRGQL